MMRPAADRFSQEYRRFTAASGAFSKQYRACLLQWSIRV